MMATTPPPQSATALRLVMLDRDGVINELREGYVTRETELRLVPGAGDAVRALRGAGLRLCVVTNQAAIGRGLVTRRGVDAIHASMCGAIGAGAIECVVCPHKPDDGCRCRKPSPGLLLDALRRFGCAPGEALFIGDHHTDYLAAVAAGVPFALVLTGHGRESDRIVPPGVPRFASLSDAARQIVDGDARW